MAAGTTRHGNAALTLAAMTLSSSMILVDQTAVPLATAEVLADLGAAVGEGQWILTANILPLAALMVFGGRLGDLLGLRRVFLAGALIFMAATAVAGGAEDFPMMIAARAVQGTGAALMMPTAVAITSAAYPGDERGRALGILAGGSAFFAALGPVLGGLLTSIDWRLVFLVNVPLAAITILLTLSATPSLRPVGDSRPRIDYPGTLTFGLGIAALVFGLSQGQADGWGSPTTVVPLVGALAFLVAFVLIELRATFGLLDFRLFRHLNFLAANLSQLLAGAIELGLGFLLPFYLLLVIGISPATAGIALIPATIPIVLAGPLAGRAFDRIGGRIPLVVGYLVLAASGLALAAGVGEQTVGALIPGLVLQGLGLGVVLTVNDPTGLAAVPPDAQGTAAGTINTTEQLGGALGIAGLSAIEVGAAERITYERLSDRGIDPSPEQIDQFKEFILHASEAGRGQTAVDSRVVRAALEDNVLAHVDSFRITFLTTVGIALLGAMVCFVLVRRDDRFYGGPVFARRSRWVWAHASASPAVTRHPPSERDG
ncbi:MAG TPA: DHA2 family efflux MFS transporter permease subunit [Thermoleophilaceae bacterium]|nr:DHA2 family efflux MFS transporter permease subunit [Thermoleophilaceae bacterium]